MHAPFRSESSVASCFKTPLFWENFFNMAEQTEIPSTHASSNTLNEKSAEIPTNDTATTPALPPFDTVRTPRISIVVVPARALKILLAGFQSMVVLFLGMYARDFDIRLERHYWHISR